MRHLSPQNPTYIHAKSFHLQYEVAAAQKVLPHYKYPPEDLMISLIDVYFHNVHFALPMIHEPTFRSDVASGLHHRNHQFGAVLLLVCATASRCSDDPRVLVEGQPGYSSGWVWYEQVEILRQLMYDGRTVWKLQACCVRTGFPFSSFCLLWKLVTNWEWDTHHS